MPFDPVRRFAPLAAALFLSGAAVAVSRGPRPWLREGAAGPAPAPAADHELIAVAPPPFTEGAFPCSQCHSPDDEVNTERRELAYHEEIVLRHDEANRWCLSCHDARDRDRLHLADGRLVEFTESYRLCGQCHGTQLRDWKAGDHGKRTGSWSGQKQYLLCASCHNPHAPKFGPIKPLPPPVRQEDLR